MYKIKRTHDNSLRYILFPRYAGIRANDCALANAKTHARRNLDPLEPGARTNKLGTQLHAHP